MKPPGPRSAADACRKRALGFPPDGRVTRDALPAAQLSMSRALRPHAEAAGRCACALGAHTICALSRCAGLWRAGCERRQREGHGAERRPKSAEGQRVCERPSRGAGAASAADTRWGRSRKTRAKTGTSGGVLTATAGAARGRAAPAGAGRTQVEARERPREAQAGTQSGQRGPETPVPGGRGGPRRRAGSQPRLRPLARLARRSLA